METDEKNNMTLERYRVEGNVVVIEMTLEEPYNIYDDRDPSPLSMRDFAEEVEEYITLSIREIPSSKKIKVIFYFDKFENGEREKELLKKSYNDFFNFQLKMKKIETKQKIKNGFKSLFVGGLFLFICIAVTSFFKGHNESIIKSFFLEGLTVLGWVSLWSPVQVFLYEIWPLSSEIKILARALKAEVDFKNVNEIPDVRKYI